MQGIQGPRGTFGAITVQRDDFSLPDSANGLGLQVECLAGSKAIGGGSSIDATSSSDIILTVSRPFRTTPGADGDNPVDGETFNAWRVVYRNPVGGTGTTTAHAYAICAQTQ